MQRLVVTCAFIVVLGGLGLPTATRGQEGQQLLNGFLKSLLDAQRERRSPGVPRAPIPRSREVDISETRDALHHLHDEANELVTALSAEVRRSPTLRYQLAEATRIRDTALWLEDQASRVDNPDVLQPDFAKLDRDWRALSRRLQQVPDLGTACRQSVRVMDERHRTLCQHFGVPVIDYNDMPRGAGNTQLVRAAQSLHEDVHGVLDRITLGMLLESRSGTRLLGAASQFANATERFTEAVANAEPAGTLAENFRIVAEAWNEFSTQVQLIRDPIVLQELRETEQSLVAVRDTLRGGRPGGERRSVNQLATQLESLAESLESVYEQRVGDNANYPRDFRRNGERLIEEFRHNAEHLREAADDGELDGVRRYYSAAAGFWDRTCTECLNRLGPVDRSQFTTFTTKINPLLDELKVQLRP